jgi:DNA repair protein RadC
MTYQIVSERRKDNPNIIKDPKDIYNLVKRYRNARQEHFIVITLDGAHKPVSVVIVSIGLVNRTIVHPREVFFRAIQDMASAIVICHNHPSCFLQPSPEDRDLTNRLEEAGNLLGIQVLDHIIFCKYGYLSFREEGLFKNEYEE